MSLHARLDLREVLSALVPVGFSRVAIREELDAAALIAHFDTAEDDAAATRAEMRLRQRLDHLGDECREMIVGSEHWRVEPGVGQTYRLTAEAVARSVVVWIEARDETLRVVVADAAI